MQMLKTEECWEKLKHTPTDLAYIRRLQTSKEEDGNQAGGDGGDGGGAPTTSIEEWAMLLLRLDVLLWQVTVSPVDCVIASLTFWLEPFLAAVLIAKTFGKQVWMVYEISVANRVPDAEPQNMYVLWLLVHGVYSM
jgi:hypothetical protein